MKNKLTGGKKFLSCSFYLYRFRKYVSYGFPIINFCNPGVHYETPCIFSSPKQSGAGHQMELSYDVHSINNVQVVVMIVEGFVPPLIAASSQQVASVKD